MQDNNKAYKFALTTVFLWSTVATAFKIALTFLTPIELLVYSVFFSTLTLYGILLFYKKTNLILNHFKTNLSKIILFALLNPFLYYLILFKAYDLLPAQEAQAINYTWALMLAFLSVPILKQKLSNWDIIAGIICYFGVVVISTQGDILSLNFSSLKGVLLALLSTVIWALYWLFNRKNNSDPIVSLFCNFAVALPMILLYYFITQDISVVPLEGILAAFYVGLFEMGFAFVFWFKAMHYTDNTSRISNLIFLSPFLSLIFIYFLVGEEILFSTIIGLIFIILGLYIQSKKLLK